MSSIFKEFISYIAFVVINIPIFIYIFYKMNETIVFKSKLFLVSLIIISLCIFPFGTIYLLPLVLVIFYDIIKNKKPFLLEDTKSQYKSSHIVLLTVLVSISVYIMSVLLLNISSYIFSKFGTATQTQDVVQNITNETDIYMLLFYLISVSIIAPISEEFVFRFGLYNILLVKKTKLNKVLAMTLTSLFFALMHANLLSFVSLFMGGLFFNYIYQKFGLRYSILAHFTFNTVSFGIMMLLKL